MSDRSFDAIIIGGGCAGFAAATALVEAGARVLLLEARPGLGGRATAFTETPGPWQFRRMSPMR